MRKGNAALVVLTGLTGVLWAPAGAQGVSAFIAGTEPHKRPEAPVVTQFTKESDWYARALKGVWSPYPRSLRFLEDQGAWFTPFNRPGMTGRYDLRGLHK